jgi:tRNA uridine 5-carboxymethylaminomethyl modification enzyme
MSTVNDLRDRRVNIEKEIERVKRTVIRPLDSVNSYLESKGSTIINNGVHLDQLLKRAELDYDVVETMAKRHDPIDERVAKQVEIEIKYQGYIDRQYSEINKFKSLEKIRIPENFDFEKTHGLSNEIKEKLMKVKPLSLGQASRIDGITPAAISVLMVSLKKYSDPYLASA